MLLKLKLWHISQVSRVSKTKNEKGLDLIPTVTKQNKIKEAGERPLIKVKNKCKYTYAKKNTLGLEQDNNYMHTKNISQINLPVL